MRVSFSGLLSASPPPPSDYTFFANHTARIMFPEFLRLYKCCGVAESVAESQRTMACSGRV